MPKRVANRRRMSREERRRRVRFTEPKNIPSPPPLVIAWWKEQVKERPYAAVATRDLRYHKVHEVLGEVPPSLVFNRVWRTYLFKTGEDRDAFIEAFYRDYHAKAASLRGRSCQSVPMKT